MAAVLDGVRVLDFGRYIAGPFCAALLADLGADVIRVEKVRGSEDRFVVPVGKLSYEFFNQQRNVLRSLAEIGKDDGNDLESVVKVATEAAFGNRFLQVTVGSRENAHVHFDRFVRSDAGISPLSRTRSNLICVGIGMSPTSSKNRVPRSAYSNLPTRSAEASVNAP